ncbi:MAG: phosphatase PAP2 family protein [Nitrospinae bacterium]|nr:phosphatase PAP2 family protein [Nitrospinota bacterium]
MQNRLFDIIMPFITEINNWKIPISLLCILFLLYGLIIPMVRGASFVEAIRYALPIYKKGVIVLILTIIGVTFSDFLNENILKPLFKRMRPCNVLQDIHMLASCTNSFSLPSAHAVNIFTTATMISYEYRRIAPYLFFFAFAISYSRVYVGVHYPFDVILGAVVGIICGAIILLLKERIISRIWKRWPKRPQKNEIWKTI